MKYNLSEILYLKSTYLYPSVSKLSPEGVCFLHASHVFIILINDTRGIIFLFYFILIL